MPKRKLVVARGCSISPPLSVLTLLGKPGDHAPRSLHGPESLPQYLHSSVHIFSMLVLQSGLGQVNGEHTGHPHKPCHTSIDEFCSDTRPWGRERQCEGRQPGLGGGKERDRAVTRQECQLHQTLGTSLCCEALTS
jgi:hypothetical protein